MSKRAPVEFNTPCGRFVGGSLYQGSKLDDKGQPKLYKTGPNAGQPRTDFSIGLAIPKTQAHWANEPGWGQAIWAEGHGAWPSGQAQRPDFSWKIIDGDSTIPNKRGNKPCDQTGYPGHWVLWFGGTQAPRLATAIGTSQPVWNDTVGFCNPGDYIEIRGSVSSNESDQTAGVYLNYNAVCMRGFGERIAQSVDLASAGFGVSPLPAGASAVPLGNALPPSAPPQTGAAPGVTPPTATPPAVPQAAAPLPTPAAPPAQVPVVPNPAILGAPPPVAVPPAPAASPVPTPPPAPAARAMLPGCPYTYEALKASNWTDAQMIAQGYLAA